RRAARRRGRDRPDPPGPVGTAERPVARLFRRRHRGAGHDQRCAGVGRAPGSRAGLMALSPRVPELGALELLLSVARLGSLGKAAREQGISQPAASSRVRYMEHLLGLPLLERSSSGSRLTPTGALVVDWARDVVESAAALDAGVAALRAQRATRLAVAASM